jgi:hypothetical protein
MAMAAGDRRDTAVAAGWPPGDHGLAAGPAWPPVDGRHVNRCRLVSNVHTISSVACNVRLTWKLWVVNGRI